MRCLVALCFLGLALTSAHAQRVCPDPFNSAPCTPSTASATGTTGAIAATLPAVAGKTTYICGFQFVRTNATAANSATNVNITDTISGTINFGSPNISPDTACAYHPPVSERSL